MKKYALGVNDKKRVVRRIEELTGLKARYTKVPRCAFQIGELFVEKDMTLTYEGTENIEDLISYLKEEDLISRELQEESEVIHIERSQPSPCQEMDPVFITPVIERWEPESATEDTKEDEWEAPETDILLPTVNTVEPAVEESEQEEDPSGDIEAQAPEDTIEAEETEEVIEEEEPSGIEVKVSIPLEGHTVTSIINLINTIYTRGALISKATGGLFCCDKSLVDAIELESSFTTKEMVMSYVKKYVTEHDGGFSGISFYNGSIVFDGFPKKEDPEHIESFSILAEKICRMCLVQSRVQAKVPDMSNEKYALRTWLNRLGMKGAEYKLVRRHLMENLSGHSAFRTEADEERARLKAKRAKDIIA